MTAQPMFRGKLLFLSNFYRRPFEHPLLATTVATSEHGFNALKTEDAAMREWVLKAPTAQEAKVRGRRVPLREDWDESYRLIAMAATLEAKFAEPYMAKRLVGTGEIELVETNFWHDQFWGDCMCSKHADVPGENMLGKQLMAIRSLKARGL